MTELDSGFEDDLREAVLDDMEDELDDATDEFVENAERNWKSYASRQGYAIEHIWQDAERTPVDRGANMVSTEVEYPALTALFEFGVDPHIIRGDPLLAFSWPAPPEGTRPPGAPSFVVAEEVNWGSVTGGIDASRAIRDALDRTRMRLRGGR